MARTSTKDMGFGRGKVTFVAKNVLTAKDYFAFIGASFGWFVFAWLISQFLYDYGFQIFLGSPTVAQFNIYSFYDTLSQVLFITQSLVLIAFFILMHSFTTILAKFLNLQVVRMYLATFIAGVLSIVVYHSILYSFAYNKAFFADIRGLVELVQSYIDALGEGYNTKVFLFSVYYLDVFVDDPSFTNYLQLLFLTKVLVPTHPDSFWFVYDYLFIYIIYIAFLTTFMAIWVRPCTLFKQLDESRTIDYGEITK